MSNYISVTLHYKGVESNNNDFVEGIDTVYLITNEEGNGVELNVENIEQESLNEYTIELLLEKWLYDGIRESLHKPNVIFVAYGEEVKADNGSVSLLEVNELDD